MHEAKELVRKAKEANVHSVITVEGGGSGRATTFKATKPRARRAPVGLTRVGGPTGNEGGVVAPTGAVYEEVTASLAASASPVAALPPVPVAQLLAAAKAEVVASEARHAAKVRSRLFCGDNAAPRGRP